jgi:large subunit ribosomal protein L23
MVFKDKLKQRAKKTADVKVLKKINVYDVIDKPILTEKAYKLSTTENDIDKKYTFKIHSDSNKNDVKQAIKYIYNVDVEKVNIVNVTYK